MTNISDALIETNKWWKKSFSLDYKGREIYTKINKFMKTRQMLAFTGLRRVGKTTLMLKIVEDKLASGLDQENIIYFSFDDFRDVKIKEIVKVYAEFMNKDLDKEEYLFLFDEIQKVKDWEEQIKRIYDNHKNFKIVLSGSESLFIRKNVRESLAGRFFEFKINPLSFNEFLDFKKIKKTALYKEEIIKAFKRYLLCNGFPEIIDADKEIIEKYIKENIIEKIIYCDIPQIFPIRDVVILENLFKIILFDPGEIINLDNLADELNISRQTVSTYMDYLEKSFLIKKVYNFSKNVRKTERKLKKYYPTIISPKLMGNPGKVLETAMVIQSDAQFFWRDVYKNEVDIVLVNGGITPVEVKSGSKFNVKPMLKFMEKFNVKKGFVISFDEEKTIKGKSIQISPAWKWLLGR
jgi:predicted AAA+ superfamily ATPase